jgi:hypothetical protein
MVWFANKGQIIQIILTLAALVLAGKKEFSEMSENNFFSAGAILFYLLVMLVLVSLSLTFRRKNEEKAVKTDGEQDRHQKIRQQFVNFVDGYTRLFALIDNDAEIQGAHVRIIYVDQDGSALARVFATFFSIMCYDPEIVPIQEHLAGAQGIVIYGCNVELVHGVAEGLRNAGFLEVQSVVERASVNREDPQWDREHSSIRIIIGRCP